MHSRGYDHPSGRTSIVSIRRSLSLTHPDACAYASEQLKLCITDGSLGAPLQSMSRSLAIAASCDCLPAAAVW